MGGDSWYLGTKAKFGNVIENSIKRAMIGMSVDEITGLFNIKNNHISDILDGEFYIWSKEFTSTAAPSVSEVTNAITNVYQAGLSRTPDAGGLLFYESRYLEVGLAQIEREMLNSIEAKNSLWKLSASDFVEKIYQAVLERAAEAAGRSHWSGQLNSGAMTKEQIIDSFLASDEFRSLCQKKRLKK